MKRFFECLIPVSVCNLKCPYCYIAQENRRSMQMAELKYSVERIVSGLTKERLGGECWFSLCGAGETLVQDETIDITDGLLNNGHFVNITTNGTLSNKIDLLLEKCQKNVKRLHLSFSLHYLELKRLNLLNAFFSNVRKARQSGASILVQINLCDDYISRIDEIKELCLKEVGAYPQVALTRDESCVPMKIFSKLSDEEYFLKGEEFNSPLFRFTFKNFNVKRKEYCYAGDWSGVLNLATGVLQKCYANSDGAQDIFEDVNSLIRFEAVGKNCLNNYCVNSSHFMSLGVIPSIKTPSYADLRNRAEAEWYSDEMVTFLNRRLYADNRKYSFLKKLFLHNSFFRKVKIKLGLTFKKNK